jgi:hypothetical protein
MSADRPAGLVGVPVTTNGIELGRTIDVLVGTDGRPVGFELVCRDGTRRFLPAAAAEIGATDIRVRSALVFLTERELGWYRDRTPAA